VHKCGAHMHSINLLPFSSSSTFTLGLGYVRLGYWAPNTIGLDFWAPN